MKRVVGYLVLIVIIFYVAFFVGFYATFNGPAGYSCQPTFTFGFSCTAPNGRVFSNR